MRSDLTRKRTFLVCGHAHSGKTSLVEALLFKAGAVSRLGKVQEGNTVSDYEEDEHQRCSSINLAVVNAEYKDNFFQFIDTPGYLDFIGDVIASVRAVDFGVIVVDATSGIEVGTERAFEALRRENVPCLFVINKLDKENTSFQNTFNDIKNNLIKQAIPFSVYDSGKIKDALEDKENIYYSQIMETVAETNDLLLEKYLETGQIAEAEFGPALKKAIVNSQIFPVFGCSSETLVGIDVLLDELTKVMPSTSDALGRKAKKGDKEVVLGNTVDGELAAQVFKTIVDPFIGKLSIFRVYSGKISSNSDVYNSTKKIKEKVGQIYILQGKQQLACDGVCAGAIGAVAKLKDTETGDVFSSPGEDIEFAPFAFPPPSYSASVKPKTRKDEEKISTALSKLMLQDPTCSTSRDSQTKELIVSGLGELHLNVIIERMKKKYGADVDLGTPKVPYRETIAKSISVQSKYKKQSGGRGQYADIWIEVEPLERGKNFEFVNKIVGGAVPKNFIPSVEKGIKNAMLSGGVLAGYPISDIRVTIFDGSYHPVDSSDMAFQIAGSMGIKKALEDAGSVMLEPIMDVEIVVPEEFMGQITGDITSRRGRVQGMEVKGKKEAVKASIPLGEMFKYASDLRSVTGGKGSYTMSFSHYDVVPQRVAQGIIDEANKAKEMAAHH
ncbi:MAG: elongation factor G [Candidatus Omnitrophica bacterium]|nr:elongation factor G [Candidatus Omnitrophota bacterium]